MTQVLHQLCTNSAKRKAGTRVMNQSLWDAGVDPGGNWLVIAPSREQKMGANGDDSCLLPPIKSYLRSRKKQALGTHTDVLINEEMIWTSTHQENQWAYPPTTEGQNWATWTTCWLEKWPLVTTPSHPSHPLLLLPSGRGNKHNIVAPHFKFKNIQNICKRTYAKEHTQNYSIIWMPSMMRIWC